LKEAVDDSLHVVGESQLGGGTDLERETSYSTNGNDLNGRIADIEDEEGYPID
jgi:hypothetical protein